jgi:hypothetical protein
MSRKIVSHVHIHITKVFSENGGKYLSTCIS